MDPTQFIGETVQTLIKAGVEVRLGPGKVVTGDDGLDCGGYYDAENKVFACAMGKEDSFEVYAHEYSHHTQDVDGFMAKFDDEIIWDWLGGKDYSYE